MSNGILSTNESATAIFTERCIFVGWFIYAVGFGVHLVLFIWCFHLLYFKKEQSLEFGTGTAIKYAEITYIDARGYPGGPYAFYLQQSSTLIIALCKSSTIVSFWLQDGLLVGLYRYWRIFGSNWYLVVLPAIMFVASIVISIFLIIELSHPGTTFWSTISVKLAIPSWSISIALNIILTILIVARLIYMRRRLLGILGTKDSDYLSITAMFIESAALVTLSSLWSLITYALNSPVAHLATPLLVQAQSIGPLLVILRVLQGRAWSKETMNNLFNTTHGDVHSDIQFCDPGPPHGHPLHGRHEESTIILVATQDKEGTNSMVTRAIKESDTVSDFNTTQVESPLVANEALASV